MNITRQLEITVLHAGLCLIALLCLGGCIGCEFKSCEYIHLISPPASLAALRRGDLSEAQQILEPMHAASPAHAELSYTLGCVYLMQSDKISEPGRRRDLQVRGWQLVEAASGRYLPAETLLTHAFSIGRWGKRRSHALYLKHDRMISEIYQAQYLDPAKPEKPSPKWQEMLTRKWADLAPNEVIYGGR